MEIRLIFWVLSALFSIAWGVLFYLIKKMENRTEDNEKTITSIRERQTILEVQQLKKKELIETINNAVRSAFLEWENKQLKEEKRK